MDRHWLTTHLLSAVLNNEPTYDSKPTPPNLPESRLIFVFETHSYNYEQPSYNYGLSDEDTHTIIYILSLEFSAKNFDLDIKQVFEEFIRIPLEFEKR